MIDLAKYIDHTILKPDATPDNVKKLCDEAKEHGFKSVCVNGCNVKLVAEQLAGTDVDTCAVVGFPLGAMDSRAKAFEVQQCVEDGADEIDMVINVGAAKSGNWNLVLSDIKAVCDAAPGKVVKVIIETCLLTDDEKIKACELAKQAGATFVKTSTGFSTGGATVEDIALMRKTVGAEMGVKASGGVRSKQVALQMIEAGATRIGTSSGIEIVKS